MSILCSFHKSLELYLILKSAAVLIRWLRAGWTFQENWKRLKCLVGPVAVNAPGSCTNQDYLSYTMGTIQWILKKREAIISDPFVVCFSWQGKWCVTVSMSVWKDRAKLICVCELGGVCMLWHCHWSSLASCSAMQGTDKDFIQVFLTHKHTTLCLSAHVWTKAVFYALFMQCHFHFAVFQLSEWYQIALNYFPW